MLVALTHILVELPILYLVYQLTVIQINLCTLVIDCHTVLPHFELLEVSCLEVSDTINKLQKLEHLWPE